MLFRSKNWQLWLKAAYSDYWFIGLVEPGNGDLAILSCEEFWGHILKVNHLQKIQSLLDLSVYLVVYVKALTETHLIVGLNESLQPSLCLLQIRAKLLMEGYFR